MLNFLKNEIRELENSFLKDSKRKTSNLINEIKMTNLQNHVALFAGLGGFILATEKLGIKTVLANEIDENCNKTLKTNFPDLYIEKKDIRELSFVDNVRNKDIDLVTAGFPVNHFQ